MSHGSEEQRIDIASTDFWIRVVDFLVVHWALIEVEGSGSRVIYFISDFSTVFDEVACSGVDQAERLLRRHEFVRYSADGPHTLFAAPPPPYWPDQHIVGRVYSEAVETDRQARRATAGARYDTHEMLRSLLDFVAAEGRVAPMPSDWNRLWNLLRRGTEESEWQLVIPLILGAHCSPPAEKRTRLRAQLELAAARGRLPSVDRYLRSLPADAWQYSWR